MVEYITGKFCLEMSGAFLGDESYYDKCFYGEHVQFVELTAKNRQDILKSRIPLCIIEYETPLYMQLKIGSYINNWTVEQEDKFRVLRIERDHKVSDHG